MYRPMQAAGTLHPKLGPNHANPLACLDSRMAFLPRLIVVEARGVGHSPVSTMKTKRATRTISIVRQQVPP